MNNVWHFDPAYSTVEFVVRNLWYNVKGRFSVLEGSIDLDEDDIRRSSVTATIKASSIDTGNKRRDAHLQAPDFFDVEKFPDIEFKSTKVAKKSDNQFELTGDLSLHGETKPIAFVITRTGEGQHPQKKVPLTGWEAHVDLKRSDWGMTGMQGAIGDDVHLIISFEALKQ